MQRQMSFSDVEYASHRVTTRKEEFLQRMDSLVPWAEWCALIAPHWHPSRPGTRDPEARQGKKGKNWHFGYKAHAGGCLAYLRWRVTTRPWEKRAQA